LGTQRILIFFLQAAIKFSAFNNVVTVRVAKISEQGNLQGLLHTYEIQVIDKSASEIDDNGDSPFMQDRSQKKKQYPAMQESSISTCK
jgi:hypothetical protein